MNMLNSAGPRIDPYGPSDVTMKILDVGEANLTFNYRSLR